MGGAVGAKTVIASIAFAIAACHHTTLREHALLLLARGDLKQGTIELEQLRDRDPDDPQAWIDLGHAYELAHRFDDALAAYDRAAEVAPKDPRGPREGGMRTARWGEYEASRPRLEEAIARGDGEVATYHALGVVLLHLKDFDAAERAYLAGLDTPQGKDDATCVLGLATIAVAREDGAAALKWYDELAKRRPDFPAAQLGRAWALVKLRRFDDANAAIDAAAALGAAPEDLAKLRGFLERERSSH